MGVAARRPEIAVALAPEPNATNASGTPTVRKLADSLPRARRRDPACPVILSKEPGTSSYNSRRHLGMGEQLAWQAADAISLQTHHLLAGRTPRLFLEAFGRGAGSAPPLPSMARRIRFR